MSNTNVSPSAPLRRMVVRICKAVMAILTLACLAPGMLLGLWGVFGLGSQIYGFLRDGHWTPAPLVSGICAQFVSSWICDPQSWLGVNRIVLGIMTPMSVPIGAVLGGLLLFLLGLFLAVILGTPITDLIEKLEGGKQQLVGAGRG